MTENQRNRSFKSIEAVNMGKQNGELMKAKSPVELGEVSVNSNTQEIDESLSDEVYELLWGHDRNTIPTAVDYAYEQIWKQLVFSNEQKEQRLSDVSLAEKLGVSRTPVRQAAAVRRTARSRAAAAHSPTRGYANPPRAS